MLQIMNTVQPPGSIMMPIMMMFGNEKQNTNTLHYKDNDEELRDKRLEMDMSHLMFSG